MQAAVVVGALELVLPPAAAVAVPAAELPAEFELLLHPARRTATAAAAPTIVQRAHDRGRADARSEDIVTFLRT
jgi:hypothetical protein